MRPNNREEAERILELMRVYEALISKESEGERDLKLFENA